ncbi:hypothetical protein LPJ53_002468 [Coemansia erecta]|uniref:Mediator of RNA polymerase II transcription subunit 25 von Willebrand factor type A domain-containing protein n=1 Tax=Coemansia erecta TaxID=147472 RepID=A0A9W7Y1A5_9FUNG|nr:hypothetical protein LPJ53_002468 [Coemansia erecta]
MVTPKQIRPAQRCDILCVLVIESTQHMQPLFHELYDSIITKIITQLRTPTIVESAGKKSQTTKASPSVRLGVVFFGDYYPYSTQTCSTQYFTSNYREFSKTIKAHNFCEGGQLRCAVTDGLVGALEMFDDFAEFDPEAHLANVQQRHVILVSSTPPYAEPCRENVHMRYDGFELDDVAKRMRELKLSFSLIQERGSKVEQVESLLKSANVSIKAPVDIPKAMSPSFEVRLMGIDLPIPPEFAEPAPQTIPIAPAGTQPQQHQQQQQQSTLTQTVPQKNKTDATSLPAESPSIAKKQKMDVDSSPAVAASPAVTGTINSPATEELSKAGASRAKSRPKPSRAGSKAGQASNSPAASANPIPSTPLTTATSVSGATQVQPPANTAGPQVSELAFANQSPAVPQPQPAPQQQQPAIPMEITQEALANALQQIANTPYAGMLTELRDRGASGDDMRIILMLASQMQNPARPQQDRIEIKRRLDMHIFKLRQNLGMGDNSGNGAQQGLPQNMPSADNKTAGNAVSATSTPQQPQQQTPQQPQQQTPQQQQQQPMPAQNMLSPSNQPAALPANVTHRLLQHTLNLVRNKLNIDVRQIFFMLTPDSFEAQVREVCREQPEVLANMQVLKTAFLQIKQLQESQMQKQQQVLQQQTPTVANAQLASPAGSQAPSGSNPGNSGIAAANNQAHTPANAVQVPNQLWHGVLTWKSKQGDSSTNLEPSCLISVTKYPGMNYTQQELRLSDWPEQIHVNGTIVAPEQFTEHCIRIGIQMVQVGVHPSASPESAKFFEDFCTTIRDMSLYVLVPFGPGAGPAGFPGIFITYFRGNLVALPFVNRQITSNITQVLGQLSAVHQASAADSNMTAAMATLAASASQPGTSISASAIGPTSSINAVPITPQQQPSALPMSGAANASLLTRSGSLGNPASTPANSATVAAQQMMSPMQQFAARPVVASPAMANAMPNQMQIIYSFLQSNMTAEQFEHLKQVPPQNRDAMAAQLFARIRANQQAQQQQQQQQAQQQQLQQQQIQQLAFQNQMQQFQAQQQAQQLAQAQQPFMQQQQQPLAQLMANQQQANSQPLGNIAALNNALPGSLGQLNSAAAAFASQPPNIQQMMLTQFLQKQLQQLQQQQQRPS